MSSDIVTTKNKASLRMAANKRIMLHALIAQRGLASLAADDACISLASHYNWLKNDEDYRDKVHEIHSRVSDWVEYQALEQIRLGDSRMIQFYLKTKCKDRGYVESKEIIHSAGDLAELRAVISSFDDAESSEY